jgi:hypothetical protein
MARKGSIERVYDYKWSTSPVNTGDIQSIYDEYIYYKYNQCTGNCANAHEMGLFVNFLQDLIAS